MGDRINVPPLRDIGEAISLYYSRVELQREDIRRLFVGRSGTGSSISDSRVSELVRAARVLQIEESVPHWSAFGVNTVCAFRAWGMDIAELEERFEKLTRHEKKLGRRAV